MSFFIIRNDEDKNDDQALPSIDDESSTEQFVDDAKVKEETQNEKQNEEEKAEENTKEPAEQKITVESEKVKSDFL